jgi:hypothetical protein
VKQRVLSCVIEEEEAETTNSTLSGSLTHASIPITVISRGSISMCTLPTANLDRIQRNSPFARCRNGGGSEGGRLRGRDGGSEGGRVTVSQPINTNPQPQALIPKP